MEMGLTIFIYREVRAHFVHLTLHVTIDSDLALCLYMGMNPLRMKKCRREEGRLAAGLEHCSLPGHGG